MKKNTTLAISLILSAASLSAFADTTSGTSTQTVSSLKDKISGNFSSALYGSSVLSPLDSKQPNTDTNTKNTGSPILLDNVVAAGYAMDNGAKLSANVEFFAEPTEGNKANAYRMADSWLKASKMNLIEKNDYSFGLDLRLGVPTSQGSRNKDMITYVRSTQYQNYNIGKTGLSLSLTTYARANAYATMTDKTAGSLYAGPSINYQISDKISTYVLYEAYTDLVQGHRLSDAQFGSDVEPGFNFNLPYNMSLNPFLDIKTSSIKGMTWETTSVNLAYSWKFL